LNKTFTQLANERLKAGLSYKLNQPVRVAYVGNLLQGNRMDYETLKRIVEQDSSVQFHIYGPFEEKDNTLGSTLSDGLKEFIAFLQSSRNVHLHGILPQAELALEMQEMDAFLTCYNYLTDYNKSSNCHKIIEYLSTGKVCISNRIITYENTEGLLEMPKEYTNENLPGLFGHVIANLQAYNAPEKQKSRILYALENTYQKHVETISTFLVEPVTG
jgi:glycosyltransferase involved in cell wall biosynthesis